MLLTAFKELFTPLWARLGLDQLWPTVLPTSLLAHGPSCDSHGKGPINHRARLGLHPSSFQRGNRPCVRGHARGIRASRTRKRGLHQPSSPTLPSIPAYPNHVAPVIPAIPAIQHLCYRHDDVEIPPGHTSAGDGHVGPQPRIWLECCGKLTVNHMSTWPVGSAPRGVAHGSTWSTERRPPHGTRVDTT
jgi:hypothetical protein